MKYTVVLLAGSIIESVTQAKCPVHHFPVQGAMWGDQEEKEIQVEKNKCSIQIFVLSPFHSFDPKKKLEKLLTVLSNWFFYLVLYPPKNPNPVFQ